MTKKERKNKIKEQLTIEHMKTHTSIFHDPIGNPKLDPYTVEKIQRSYKLWFDSWIKDELEYLLK